MSIRRTALAGGRGVATVVGLSTLLGVLVAGQLPASAAELRPPAAVTSVLGALVPSLAPTAPTAPTTPTAPAAPDAPSAAPAPAAGDAAGPIAPRAVVDVVDRLLGTFVPPPPPPPPPPVLAASTATARTVAAPSVAAPSAPSLCSGEGWQQRRGGAALASLRGGAERTGFTVAFHPARSGYMGLAMLDERRVDVFVRDCGAQSDELLRHVVAHELGHAYDTTRMSEASRAEWKAARGIPAGTDWYGCSGCTDFATPAGDFAEVYAQWARGATTNRSELAGDVPAAALAGLAGQFFGA